jgi:transcriptional regulator with XRE-family HTH domain
MNDIKSIVAKNIAALRQSHGMTQLELAERLNYSDKAVSKWERAESLPDITVLVTISDLFGVTLDQLVRDETPQADVSRPVYRYDRAMITGVSLLLVWFVALLAFVLQTVFVPAARMSWLTFVWAVPATMILWLVLNSIWFRRRRNYLIISLLMWSMLAAIHMTMLPYLGVRLWIIYLLGIPGQAAIVLWSRFKRKIN